MKQVLNYENTRQIGKLLNEDCYKIRIEQFNEYKLEDRIKENQLEWLDEVYDYVRAKLNIKDQLKTKQQKPYYCLALDDQSNIDLETLADLKKELEQK